jgi:hypothetical protein
MRESFPAISRRKISGIRKICPFELVAPVKSVSFSAIAAPGIRAVNRELGAFS